MFYKRNFALIESSTVLAASGGVRKDRAFEITKDGFMFLVMGFTGKEAAQLKEAYINAFNFMLAKLKPIPNALRELPRPNITGMEAAQLKKSVEAAAKTNKKLYSELYRKLYAAYGIKGYADLPAGKLNEALVFLGLKPVEMPKTVMISVEEYNALKMSKPEPKQGVLVDMPTLMLALPNDNNRIVVIRHNGVTSMFEMPEDYLFGSPETLARDLKAMGYIVVKKQELIARLEA